MSIFGSLSPSPIGLDVGGRQIKAVQLGGSRSKPVVTASAMLGRSQPGAPIDADEAQRIRRVLAQQGFVGRRVVLAAPSECLLSSVIDMPPKESGAPYDVIAAQEFARLQRQQPGRFEVGWWEIPRPVRSPATKVMAVGCAHADSEPMINAFESAGLDVAALDSGLCAAVRASLDQLDSYAGVSALLDIGWASARLALVYQGVVIIDRALAGSGLSKMNERVCLSMGMEPAEAEALLQAVGLHAGDHADAQADERYKAIAPQIKRALGSYLGDLASELDASFEYAGHQYPDVEPRSLVLAGGGGAIPGLAEQLNGMVAAHVMRASIDSAGQRSDDVSKVSGPLLIGATGLAGSGEGG